MTLFYHKNKVALQASTNIEKVTKQYKLFDVDVSHHRYMHQS